MEINDLSTFLDYYAKIRVRTRRVAVLVPPAQLEGRYRPGVFSPGDLIRHIAAIERWLYAEMVTGRPPAYRGCGPEIADGQEAVLLYLDEMHRQSVEIFSGLTPEDLQRKIQTPSGSPITCWKWLRAMVEHEIHHRGQLYQYLSMLNVPAPPIFGLTSEEVKEISGREG